ncbi:nucleotidyl transferase AbiEii/AbiGii toxin family protein [Moorella sp. Hama-1]|uniref:nucleotidyl transferase AbiEii/AbiGii toxin family protein n=1 Tax=Moorella sp. Hama-1 TaxID=2138101 RepID=UPI000D64CEDB|nr:nucleotidyl transferase AbiEii/AbiGii toxin family protein [Moorella sp. Hama-1]BCV21685.1 hypothetical protein hamaS1_17540 [Moorella sp. Hama-1]
MAAAWENILGDRTKAVLEVLAASKIGRKFYLAGGTGLSLQIWHRRSFDLDFFQSGTEEKLKFNQLYRQLKESFLTADLQLVSRQVDQAMWEIKGVKVTFLTYPFPLLFKLIEGEIISPILKGLRLASPEEIALMKAYAVGRRATFRDYVDLYFLLTQGVITLEGIIAGANKKFVLHGDPLFGSRLFLEQLVYTEDLEDKEAVLNMVLEPRPDLNTINGYFSDQVRFFLKRQITVEEQEGGSGFSSPG